MRRQRVPKRQSYSDYDYPEGDKLDQIIRPFPGGISIPEKTRSANAE
jgi:hypothetical protein